MLSLRDAGVDISNYLEEKKKLKEELEKFKKEKLSDHNKSVGVH
jgi:hypothetical protein